MDVHFFNDVQRQDIWNQMPQAHKNTTFQHRTPMRIGEMKDKRHYCAIISHVFKFLHFITIYCRQQTYNRI